MTRRSAGRILVVEDDGDLRQAVADLFEEEGYEVHTAAEGREALEVCAEAGYPDLVLLDLLMPGLDGRRFVAAMSERRVLSRVPVVVTSGCLEGPLPRAAAYLSKPVDPASLVAVVRRVLDQRTH